MKNWQARGKAEWGSRKKYFFTRKKVPISVVPLKEKARKAQLENCKKNVDFNIDYLLHQSFQ